MTQPVDIVRVAAVCVGRVRDHTDGAGAWRSAGLKQAQAGPVPVGREGLAGDEVADRLHHGGPDKALLAWAASHNAPLERLFRRPLPPGSFGENLLLEGLDEELVCLGDRWTACSGDGGDDDDPPTDGPVLEVSQPRQPCRTPGRLHGLPELSRHMAQSGSTGWYLRVLVPGRLAAGDRLRLLHRPWPDWTVRRCWRVFQARRERPLEWLALQSLPELSAAWR